MTESLTTIPEKTWAKSAARIGWAILIVATLYVCYFSHLGAIGFVGPDEPRYAWIARDMAETGDWVTPRLYDKPWFEKPPLYYWGAALCFKLFGVSEAAARLPSAVSALLATLALAWLALCLYGAETARWLLLLLPTSVGMIGFSRAAATDMPFSGMLTIAMVCAAVVLGLTRDANTPVIPRTPWVALIFFGFFLGLAVLAKGPAAILLSGGAVFFWAIFTKRWRDAFRLLHPAAIVTFCLTALPWYILCARRNPDFLRVFLIEHNFKRYLTPEFQHIQPVWFYIPVLLVALLPWTPLLLWSESVATVRLWRMKQIAEPAAYFLAWALVCVAFFSTSKSKLPGYILPSVPAISALLARSCATFASSYRKSFCLVHWTAAIILLASSIVIGTFTRHMSSTNQRFAAAASFVAASIGLANLILGCFHGRITAHRLAAACSVLPILAVLCLAAKFTPLLFVWDPSGRSIAHELQLRKIPSDRLALLGMNRGLHYSLNFYLRDEIKDWDQDHASDGYLLTGGRSCKYVAPPTLACEEVPFDLASTGRFLYRLVPANSPDNLPRSGQPQQKK